MMLKITPKQRTKINALVRRACCNCYKGTVCCLMTAKNRNAFSSFHGTVSTATIF